MLGKTQNAQKQISMGAYRNCIFFQKNDIVPLKRVGPQKMSPIKCHNNKMSQQ